MTKTTCLTGVFSLSLLLTLSADVRECCRGPGHIHPCCSPGSACCGNASTPTVAGLKNDGERLLQEAKSITGKYDTDPGLKVSDGKNGRFNCTTYVETAIRKAGFEVTPSMSKQINVVLPEGADLSELLKENDPRMTGIVGALVDSGQGSMVKDCKNIQKGDLIQMWRLKKDGTSYEGHTGIIENANGRDIVLWGAHKSLDRVDGKPYHLGEWKHAWCVRPEKK
jgi:hypothetical protein